jgi:hypothetical protein
MPRMAKARQGMTNYLGTRVILLKTPGSGRSENLQMFPRLRLSCVIKLNLTAPAWRPNRTLKPPGKTNLNGSPRVASSDDRLPFWPRGMAGRGARLSQKETPFSSKLDVGGHPHELRMLGGEP